MKKYIKTIAMLSFLVAGLSFASSAQVYVKVRPSAPVVVRPVAPSPRHVWIDGGWTVRGGRYVWTEGYWATPRHGRHYVPGRWDHRRGGWVWVGGYWRR
ncbi:MAG: hypothetical protein QM731_00810 [Chitinophagaceae bacterium]